MAGERNPNDVVHYPRIRRSMIKGPGRRRWVELGRSARTVKDDAELRATIVALVPNTRVAAIVPLPAGPRAQTYRADVIADGRSQTWFIKHFPEPSGHATQEFNSHERLRGVVGVTPTLIAADIERRVLIVEYLTHALDLFVALRRCTDPLNVDARTRPPDRAPGDPRPAAATIRR